MQTFFRSMKGLLAGFAILASAVSADARADYQYLYTGNTFTVVADSIVEIGPGVFENQRTTYDAHITATLITSNLLTNGSNLDDVTKFSVTLNQDFNGISVQQILYYPYPFAGPLDPPGTSGNPNNVPVFNIAAVDAAGLPAAWDISIDNEYVVPTGRHFHSFYQTSNGLDLALGGYEGFFSYSGSLANTPGSWTVSAVPEAQTYVLLLAGLALLGVASRRKARPETGGAVAGAAAA
jgi:hypothetical protein